MATVRDKQPSPRAKRSSGSSAVATAASARARVVDDVVDGLVAAYESDTAVSLDKLKAAAAKRHGTGELPKLVELLAAVPDSYRDVLVPKLRAKPVRSSSGIVIVAVMSKPHRCPHIYTTGNICLYCPGGPDSAFAYSAQSYTGYEPTSMRAIRARYDPYVQVRSRIEQLRALGHSAEKVEFVLQGGTFMSLAADYRGFFIRNLHDALSGHASSDVREAVQYGEHARLKCIGLTIETRPDFCQRPHIDAMLLYGCTRLEIGVQSVYEDIAKLTNRGHTVQAVIDCFHLSKDAGYKVVAHLMPNLPDMDRERDVECFREFFANPAFRADGLKVYPTLILASTGLYELWKAGRYRTMPPAELVDHVAELLSFVPPWVRVYRVQRDIPMPLVTSGVQVGNLRELVLVRMRDLGLPCRDVRTREVGIREIHQQGRPERVELVRRDYVANGGWETFLAYEDPARDILVGLLRLRRLSDARTYRRELRAVDASATLAADGGNDGRGRDGARPVGACTDSRDDGDERIDDDDEDDSTDDDDYDAIVPDTPDLDVARAHAHTASNPGTGAVRVTAAARRRRHRRRHAHLPCSMVRELHVYGTVVPVHERDPSQSQHRGYGTLLMEEAERVARDEHGAVRMAVISGVGTRHYYRKLGYELDGPYMVKSLAVAPTEVTATTM